MKQEISCFELIDKVRYSDELASYDIIKLLKEFTCGYDLELLRALLKDIDLYLFMEKDECEAKFSDEEVAKAIEDRSASGLDIPTYNRTNFENLTEKGKASVLKRYGSEEAYNISPKYINKEQLLFPFEFINVYSLKNQIISKLEEVESPKIASLKWEGTNIELVELTKALIVAGKISGTQKEIFKNITSFLNVEVSDVDKSINDVKARVNPTKFLESLKLKFDDFCNK